MLHLCIYHLCIYVRTIYLPTYLIFKMNTETSTVCFGIRIPSFSYSCIEYVGFSQNDVWMYALGKPLLIIVSTKLQYFSFTCQQCWESSSLVPTGPCASCPLRGAPQSISWPDLELEMQPRRPSHSLEQQGKAGGRRATSSDSGSPSKQLSEFLHTYSTCCSLARTWLQGEP